MSTTELSSKTKNQLPAKHDNGGELGLLSALVDVEAWNRVAKMAEIYAGSTLVPDHFKKNVGNCLIALQLAMRMQVDPFMLMQNLYVVSGKPGLEAKFAIAMCNSKKVFRGPIRYTLTGKGKTRECMAYAFDRETGEKVDCTVTFEIAEKEGWVDKKGSKWKTMPDQMLKYRSAMWLIRTTCPEVLMGMQSTDELEDIAPVVIEQTAIVDDRSKSEQLAEQLKNKKTAEPKEAPPDPTEPQPDEPEQPWPDAKNPTVASFEADMEAALDLDGLTDVANRAFSSGLSLSDQEVLHTLHSKLEESFA